MANSKTRELGTGYTSQLDFLDEQKWYQVLEEFDDANIFQTWAYAVVTSGRRNMSHLLLKQNGTIVALALARIAKLPGINVGIAYVRWGPLWRRRMTEDNPEIFRQAVRALRNEFACRRGMVVKLLPILFDTDPAYYTTILTEEGFSSAGTKSSSRTILMDLHPTLDYLRQGMRPHWKRELKLAERKSLEVFQGSADELFESVIAIHSEMVFRKKFVEGSNINQFRLMQTLLPENLKMKILICKSGAGICAGLICSAIGNTAVYLFGATSNLGTKSNGSYLLHWKLIEQLKKDGLVVYDLYGINEATNPGTYRFKNDLAGSCGKHVRYLGQFESHVSVFSHICVQLGESLRTAYRRLKVPARVRRRVPLMTKNVN